MRTRVYLDNCCFNRPFDDLSNTDVRLEAEAKMFVQEKIRAGELELAWSFVLDYENAGNPHAERRNAIAPWKSLAVVDVGAGDEVHRLGRVIAKSGMRSMDALHVACAIKAGCGYFLTTDKKVLNKRVAGITILNPVEYIREEEGGK